MEVFLTSSPAGEYLQESKEYPVKLNEDNGFVQKLKALWRENSKGLIVAAFPDRYDISDEMKKSYTDSFNASGLSVDEIKVCDSRNFEDIGSLLEEADFVILSGGHVPTENAFFKKIGLKEKLKGFNKILIGISAGSMNSAELVYAQPEMDGESTDVNFNKFLEGLGLVKTMIIPHYQVTKGFMLDGKRLFEDITFGDSMGKEFYAIVDGSYLHIENGKEVLYGEAYLIKDGKIKKLTEKGESIVCC